MVRLSRSKTAKAGRKRKISEKGLKSLDHRLYAREEEEEEEFEPPDGFEDEIQGLMDSLSDKVSIADWVDIGLGMLYWKNDLTDSLCSYRTLSSDILPLNI